MFSLLILSMAATLPAMDKLESLKTRRQKLMPQLASGPTIMVSGQSYLRNGDTAYPYRQNSNFLYLTGFSHSNAVCLLLPGNAAPFQMFVNPKNPQATIWVGEQPGLEGATDDCGADAAFPLSGLSRHLKKIIAEADTIYFSTGNDPISKRIQRLIDRAKKKRDLTILDPRPAIHALRLLKDDYEISLIQKAIDITCESQAEAMRMARPGMTENEIQAAIEYVYKKQGALAHGFPSIVGSGPNSTVLHYEDGTRTVEDGDLVLMDIGAEYEGYSADVTRTMPANGRFTDDQRAIYEIVLASADAAFDSVKPGVGLLDIHKTSAKVIAQGLKRMGLITDEAAAWQINIFMMYNSNHWLGLDVHDVGGRRNTQGEPMPLEPGMVFTVEPGIYVGKATLELARQRARRAGADVEAFIQVIEPAVKRYMNIGVRIEDDLLVTAEGYRNLSAAAPRTVAEVEAMMARSTKHVIVK